MIRELWRWLNYEPEPEPEPLDTPLEAALLALRKLSGSEDNQARYIRIAVHLSLAAPYPDLVERVVPLVIVMYSRGEITEQELHEYGIRIRPPADQ